MTSMICCDRPVSVEDFVHDDGIVSTNFNCEVCGVAIKLRDAEARLAPLGDGASNLKLVALAQSRGF